MAKLLVVGGSHSDLPLIESGILHGLDVYTTGNRPDHPGHRFARGYLPGDFSNPEEMLAVARRLGADFVVPGANDFAMMSAAYTAERMALPGFDSFATTSMLHHKDQFKAFAESIGMPICRYVTLQPNATESVDRLVSTLTYPLIVKPVDLTGGKGISRVNTPSELFAALDKAFLLGRHKVAIAEEWFEGSLHSYSTVIEGGEIVFEYFDTELCLFQDFLVSTSLSLCHVHRDAREMVCRSTRKMIKELGLANGVLHSQFLACEGDVRILEYTRRMSGDLYSKVVQQVRGFRHSDIFIASAMGRPLSPLLKPARPTRTQNFVSRHCITATVNGNFARLEIAERMHPYVESITPIIPFGTPVTDDGRSKVAVVILSFPSEQLMLNYAATCKNDFQCGVEIC